MIKFIDFVPQITKKTWLKTKVEDMEPALERLNEWLQENQDCEMVNIETILLPNIHNANEEGSTDTNLRTHGEVGSNWYQVFRLWYRDTTKQSSYSRL